MKPLEERRVRETNRLVQACRDGDLKVVVEELKNGTDVNVKEGKDDEDGLGFWNPLYTACSSGHAPVVKHLLTVPGVDVNVKSYGHDYPLNAAIRNHHVEVARLMLTDCKALHLALNINAPGYASWTPVGTACNEAAAGSGDVRKMMMAMIRTLAEFGADLTVEARNAPIVEAAILGEDNFHLPHQQLQQNQQQPAFFMGDEAQDGAYPADNGGGWGDEDGGDDGDGDDYAGDFGAGPAPQANQAAFLNQMMQDPAFLQQILAAQGQLPPDGDDQQGDQQQQQDDEPEDGFY